MQHKAGQDRHLLAWPREKLHFVEEGRGQGSIPPGNLPRPEKRGLVEEDNIAWSVVLLKLVNIERKDSETMRRRVALEQQGFLMIDRPVYINLVSGSSTDWFQRPRKRGRPPLYLFAVFRVGRYAHFICYAHHVPLLASLCKGGIVDMWSTFLKTLPHSTKNPFRIINVIVVKKGSNHSHGDLRYIITCPTVASYTQPALSIEQYTYQPQKMGISQFRSIADQH